MVSGIGKGHGVGRLSSQVKDVDGFDVEWVAMEMRRRFVELGR